MKIWIISVGNAGAIVAAMKLYQLTGEIEYCTAAVETEKDLWKKGQRMEVDMDGN